jgi:acid phosphatase (class A)
MKNILLLITLLSSPYAFAQAPTELLTSPARGHYKQLAAFSPKSTGQSSIDTLRFPYNAVVAEKRLSLKPIFLTKTTLADFTLPNAPANNSEFTRAELNYLLTLQQQRTELEVHASLVMAGIYYNARTKPGDSLYHNYRQNLFFIGHSIGTWFNPDQLPLTAELMAKVWQDASYFIWSFKYLYARVRPYVLEPSLNNLEETNWAAYPSGHAANSYINAYIYAALAPDYSDVFLKDAYDMAHSREIIGVHYPSDSETSRLLAQQLVTKLFANKEFLVAFEKVKEEWKAKAIEDFKKPADTKVKGLIPATSCAKKCE